VWIDDEGVTHTVALPDPSRVMADDFRTSLDTIAVSDHAALRGVVERAESRANQADWSELKGSEVHVGAPAPSDLLHGRVLTREDVAHAIDRVAPRWRLDVILALDDYLD
jgi:hypothetical protein